MPYKNPEDLRAQRRRYYQANRDKIIAKANAWQQEHAEERRVYLAQYYQENKEELLEKAHDYREDHLEECRLRSRTYHAEHKDDIKVQKAQYREEHKDEIVERNKQYYEENKDRLLEEKRQHYVEHIEEAQIRSAKYRAKHAEEIRLKKAAYNKDHPEQRLDGQRRRRARKENAPVIDLSDEQWNEVREHFQHRCVYCPPTCKACKNKTHELTQDHITPYQHNGSHTLWNVVPACQSHNSQKGTGGPLKPIQPLLLTLAPSKPYKRRTKKKKD